MSKTSSSDASLKEKLWQGLYSSLDTEFGSKDLTRYQNDPIAFCREIIGVEPTKEQSLILEALAKHGHVSVRSGHGIGKSSCMAFASLWFMSCFPFVKIPATAPSSNQLFDIYWGELIRRWREMKEPYKSMFDATSEKFFHKDHKETWAIFPRTARPEKPEALQGFHGENLMFLLDEASGIHESIFQVAQGSLTSKDNKVLMCSNPIRLSGFFFDSHHADRGRWATFHFSSEDSELVVLITTLYPQ